MNRIPDPARDHYRTALMTIQALMRLRGLDRPPVDLSILTRAMGIKSVESGAITPDAMLVKVANGFKIVLKSGVPQTRTRFSWAHELAHLLLDRPTEGTAVFRNVEEKAVESLCDDLAAEILMPILIFSKHVQQLGFGLPIVPRLAARFSTSLEATAIRMVKTSGTVSVLSKWQSRSGIGGTRRWWDISSPPGVRIHFPLGANSQPQPIEEALMNGGHTRGKIPILIGYNTSTAQPFDAEIQAFGIGAPSYRRVLSLTTW